MDKNYIVTAYVVLDDLLRAMKHREDPRTAVSAAEVLAVVVVAARYFQNRHERALWVLQRIGALPQLLRVALPGKAKTHFQHLVTAATINLIRVLDRLHEILRSTTPKSHFARLAA